MNWRPHAPHAALSFAYLSTANNQNVLALGLPGKDEATPWLHLGELRLSGCHGVREIKK